MVKLRQDSNGNYIARKRLPDDVRDEYKRRHGARLEAKFLTPASAGADAAKRKFRKWDTEIAERIATIRAELAGEAASTGAGVPLTREQSRALAGEWYTWFITRHPLRDLGAWENLRDQIYEALREAVGEAEWERSDPDDLWREDAELRKAVRPVLADAGETAQFLASKGLILNHEAQGRFIDWLYDDLSAALHKLTRIAQGDYRDDKYAERFPKFVGDDNGDTPQQLFDKWVSAKGPAASTVETWRYVFAAMTAHFPERSAGSIAPGEAQEWISSLIGPKRSAGTVDKNWIAASKTIFGWATEHKHTPRNPFAAVKVTIPKTVKLRETQAFRPNERRTILAASLCISDTETPDNAARRWVPWLCAYTGARPGEITQLRGRDVEKHDGIPALAEKERAMISTRTKAALAAAKARGVVLGGPKLAKARKNAVASIKALADQHAANVLPVIREIRRTGVASLHQIADALNARGIATPRGGQWYASSVRNVLERA